MGTFGAVDQYLTSLDKLCEWPFLNLEFSFSGVPANSNDELFFSPSIWGSLLFWPALFARRKQGSNFRRRHHIALYSRKYRLS
jgi:hypothetical protein